ncbi:MAG: hypothetical protein HQM10_05165 [Candidatus Riflebacteria bacterium]|nr:hypothetical protein [Candidatus Riflebacteria bacterium]
MKNELRDKKNVSGKNKKNYDLVQINNDEAAIDITQILVANQTLLKNVCRKMETLENRFQNLMTKLEFNENLENLIPAKKTLLLSAPKPVKKWEPDSPELNSNYFSRFSIWTRIFRPERMRRSDSD